MPTLVTGLQLGTGIVTIDVPGGDLLARAGAGLAKMQQQVEQLEEEMIRLQEAGIFLDEESSPVVPGWWEKKENDQHVAWYIVWPTGYARKAGIKRRQYIKPADYEATKAKAQRTLEYASLKLRRDKLAGQIERAGQELAGMAEKYGW